MSIRGSVSQWIDGAKASDQDAIQSLWERYFTQLVDLGRRRLRGAGNRKALADEEDAAVDAFASFCRAAEAGRFPDLTNRDELWRVLMTLTLQKIIDQNRFEGRQKRGGGAVRGESVLVGADARQAQGFAEVIGSAPTPEHAVIVGEQCDHLLHLLDEETRHVAVAKLEGFTNREVAAQLGKSLSSVERSLRLIRKKWSRLLEEQEID